MMKQISDRQSIRNYINKPVDDDLILALVESAWNAPSGSNTKPWHFIIVKDPIIKEQIARVSHDQKWMLTAPVFIVCVSDIKSRITDNELVIDEESSQHEVKQIIRDTAIAIEHIVLEAINNNLGTCWVSWFTQKEIRPILNIPNNKYVVTILAIGYHNEKPRNKNRKDIKEIIHINKW